MPESFHHDAEARGKLNDGLQKDQSSEYPESPSFQETKEQQNSALKALENSPSKEDIQELLASWTFTQIEDAAQQQAYLDLINSPGKPASLATLMERMTEAYLNQHIDLAEAVDQGEMSMDDASRMALREVFDWAREKVNPSQRAKAEKVLGDMQTALGIQINNTLDDTGVFAEPEVPSGGKPLNAPGTFNEPEQETTPEAGQKTVSDALQRLAGGAHYQLLQETFHNWLRGQFQKNPEDLDRFEGEVQRNGGAYGVPIEKYLDAATEIVAQRGPMNPDKLIAMRNLINTVLDEVGLVDLKTQNQINDEIMGTN